MYSFLSRFKNPVTPGAFTVPEGTRLYAVGDIHGRSDLLSDLLACIATDLLSHPVRDMQLVFLGDYIDRGTSSGEVIQALCNLGADGYSTFLRGNHEQILLNFLKDASILNDWRRFGGLETLEAYNVPTHKVRQGFGFEEAQQTLLRHMPQSHLTFLQETQFSHVVGGYFFCHAGVNPERSLVRQKARDLMWIRNEFLACDRLFDKKIVHGHTPVPAVDIRPNRINVDTGAYESGYLSCVALEDDCVRVLGTNEAQAAKKVFAQSR